MLPAAGAVCAGMTHPNCPTADGGPTLVATSSDIKGSLGQKLVQAVLVRIHQQVHSVADIELAIDGREMIAQRVQADVQGRGDHLARRALMFNDRYNDFALLLSQSSDARGGRVDLLLRAASTKGSQRPSP